MPPVFKKPVEYDPTLANKTLAHTHSQSEDAQAIKRRQMLAELGLPDDDEPEVEEERGGDDGEEEDEERHERQHEDLGVSAVDKEFLIQRNNEIDEKGYTRFLKDMLHRAQSSLQMLRSDPRQRYLSCVDVIAELEYELAEMYQDNDDLRRRLLDNMDVDLPLGRDDDYEQLIEQVQELRVELLKAQSAERAQTDKVADLERQLRRAQASLRDAGEAAAEGTAAAEAAAAAAAAMPEQVYRLESQLAAQEARFKKKEADLTAQVAELRQQLQSGGYSKASSAALSPRKGKRAGSGLMDDPATEAKLAEAARRVQELEMICEEFGTKAEMLQTRARDAEAQVLKKEEEFNARLQNMTAGNAQASALSKQMAEQSEQHARRVEELQSELQRKEALVAQLQAQKADALSRAHQLQSRVEAASEAKGRADELHKQLHALHALREDVLADLLAMKNEVFSDKALQQMGRNIRDREVAAMRKMKVEFKHELEQAQEDAREARESIERIQKQAQEEIRVHELESEAKIEVFRHKWRVEFDKRRKLHNQVLELKGNIRVLCRVRPLVDKERANNAKDENMPVRCTSEEVVRIVMADKNEKDFEFDKLFAPTDDQAAIFEEVSPLIVSMLDGYNVAIMAYGQTGSGKTHTMEGPESNPGVNIRALAELFKVADDRKENFTYTFKASILEIYNEQIFDLLVSGKDQDDKLDIKQNPEGGMHVPGLKVETVANVQEVNAIIQRGKSNRSTFATNMNEHSSRSHLVLSVYVTAVAKRGSTTMRGKLHLIDLAGSERLSKTGAQGDRLKEAQNINKSLSALGDVIQALQQREKHIPYRNSKLTRLLEDSLGSSSKCVMVVNVSPAAENVPETKCSLEFASRARKVELGRARATVESTPAAKGTGTPGGGGSGPSSGAATPVPGSGSRLGATPGSSGGRR